ncbi:MAG: polymer-forming cytoskeletal protein [Spirochaetes bacterium]|nr:polymer-forming cytoskeletal protein [Spirochaetota bacterium]
MSSAKSTERFYEKYGTKFYTFNKDKEINGDIDKTDGDYNNIKISCKYSGNINVNGVVYIDNKGDFDGSINAAGIIISGKSDGTIRASEKIEVRKDSHIRGRLITPDLAKDTEADFDAIVQTPEEADRADNLEEDDFVLYLEKRNDLELLIE